MLASIKSASPGSPGKITVKTERELTCLQNKVYPREVDRNVRGRIRVQLRNDDGTPVVPQFPTRQYGLLILT